MLENDSLLIDVEVHLLAESLECHLPKLARLWKGGEGKGQMPEGKVLHDTMVRRYGEMRGVGQKTPATRREEEDRGSDVEFVESMISIERPEIGQRKDALGIGAELVGGDGGIFDVAVDGRVVFSKEKSGDFIEAPEAVELIRASVG